MKKYLIYMVTNTLNGKKYIGMTCRTAKARWSAHCSSARNGSPYRFHSAIRKYGEENFKLDVLLDGLDVDNCRILEECLIIEEKCIENGYNAKPGGCGGWIVPDEKYDEWLKNISISSKKENNGRWSGYSDEFILDECVKIYHEYIDDYDFSFTDILNKLREKYQGIPKSFSKNRFSDYNGCFKTGLSIKLGIDLEILESYSRMKGRKHRQNLSETNTGSLWYSNDELKTSKQFKNNPGEGWYRGREYGNKN